MSPDVYCTMSPDIRKDRGKMGHDVELWFWAPETNTARIQKVHIAVLHILCSLIEGELFG